MTVSKFRDVLFFLLSSAMLLATASVIPDVCKYKGRQMTVGQTFKDCFGVVSCLKNGLVKFEESCLAYDCARQSMWHGQKNFDLRKPYPECCGGPICEDNEILYRNTVKKFIPKKILKLSPHVMGIKFA